MTKFFLTILLICFTTLSWGQSAQQKKLEERKAQILKEMEELRNLVSKENKKEKTVLNKIDDNRTKIKLSENLISTTTKQTRLLTDDIYTNQIKINKLTKELNVLKEDYANMIVKAYKNRSEQSRIMFILSSETFLQAYKRMQYMKQFSSFRKIQGEEIKSKMAEAERLDAALGGQKKEKEKLLAESEDQKEVLEKDKEEQEQLVKSIQKDKKKYAADIKKKQKEQKDIDRKIDKIIKDAIIAANKRAAEKAAAKTAAAKAAAVKAAAAKATPAEKKKGKETAVAAAKAAPATKATTNKITLTKESKLESDSFKANKGKLPWPVAEGAVSVKFGLQRDPFGNNFQIDSKSIEITTKPGTTVRSIFNGEVLDVQVIGGTRNKIVLISHGDFITVYCNLSTINVRTGDKVSTKDTIGTVATSPSGKTALTFYIMQNTTPLNPSSWITK
ncbi:murein hydrolase activator EnvC family protein [Flavobacterium cerinum]|uniref:Peptidase M23 n=1 Tax=Flavobacterium cerinum TaxID=2502784 RepID=A0A444H9V6_9FLAO|nr:peptidoglycan DD-metalloendopeptidase family protein [Flavobacterium cerinum]RWX00024.1 peptidase M23 [Flavobacterium cerinum]